MSAVFKKLLDAHTCERYYVEYGGFLSNHLSHGLIALYRLGATEDFIQQFAHLYSARLEPVDGPSQQKQILGDPDISMEALKGKRQDYYRILQHFRSILSEEHGGCMEAMIGAELPLLVQGVAGSALHGMIHLGYGFSARNPQLVCEGLAYLHHSCLPLLGTDAAPETTSLGQGPRGILEVIDLIRADPDLRRVMLYECKEEWVTRRGLGGFQSRMVALLTMRGDTLLRYAHQIKFPQFFNPDTLDAAQIEQTAKWLIDCAIVLYQVSERRNDFFLIHAVTSSWAVLQCLLCIDDVTVSMKAVQVQLAVLLAVYVARDSPAINTEHLKEPDVSGLTWTDVKARVLGLDPDTDEHIFKLVQVCYDMGKSSSGSAMDDIYKRACLTAVNTLLYV